MLARKTTNRYHPLSIGLHWLMLLLLIVVYACIELREFYPKGSNIREGLKALHFMLGLSVLVLFCVRIYARLKTPTPNITPEPAPWQSLSAKVMHVALYAFMISMPFLGWLLLSASGKPIPFFGLELPALIAKNKALADSIKEVHEIIGTIGYFLIGAHALAAFYHHFFLRDNTLLRILPTFNKENTTTLRKP